MASTTGDPEKWSPRARPAAPADEPTSSLDPGAHALDPLSAAALAPPTRDAPPRNDERDPFGGDEPIYAPRPRRTPPPRQRPRRVKQVRRVRRTLRHIDPFSILKVSLMFYGCFLVLWMVFVAILYWVLQSAGVFDTVESLRQSLTIRGSWELSLSFVEKWAFFLGLGVAVVMSLFNTFLAVLYNVIADTIGGIDMTFVERD